MLLIVLNALPYYPYIYLVVLVAYQLHFELYTDRKDPETEGIIEAVLDRHGIFYDKTEVWIESERLYEVLYSMEVLNG